MSTMNREKPTYSSQSVKPRIIIHGGAGNLTRTTLSREQYAAYQVSLRRILASSWALLSVPGAKAIDIATYAVSQLEDDPLYNSGKGAVFTRAGTIELESSIMVSNGYRKRGVSCMLLKHVKNPIKLARELLVRGEEPNGGGAQDHCQYSGGYVEKLAEEWGFERVDPSYFYTEKRWREHKRGLKEKDHQFEQSRTSDYVPDVSLLSEWERTHYIPLGTCGAVVLDGSGAICVATSTGGLTNKLPGRIGDTPTMGTGFWAEEWQNLVSFSNLPKIPQRPATRLPLERFSRGDLFSLVNDCLPSLSRPSPPLTDYRPPPATHKLRPTRTAVALSGTGNGDTFIRMAACRTIAAKSRFTGAPLSDTVSWMAGRGGELQRSAGHRWGVTHEGVGGIIGIELCGTQSSVVWDFNCGGMFRAWVEEDGTMKSLIFREDDYDSGPK
ncbi:L-asparaginase precursor [Sporormia fimetaria CBS 119925]|uniref:L-asparaginase n=1 Tax=Sporormia fimetaria CBS 119925 TaxID=1340428 RepID=A0A6A6V6C7_9PLEO|nr:L-asparaginase precursor [Sporormia fimetaria CBS 119925]